ncbi:patatin-like phospholipase family protein [Cecembia sp.]|uniref:patatin-like phospholipase family protein n=1 Tax=Cecembia sp. TaxID=1898110 RepID=UPI0025B89191|nr:patatin-like phospholipase family protein [Cecembia sp.]
MKKTALVLSGGGFKGAFQVGALAYLKENWGKVVPGKPNMHFDVIAGVSVGSLNGLLIAQDKFDDLLELWDKVAENGVSEIYQSDFIDTRPDHSDPNPKLKMKISWESIKKHFPKTTRNVLWRAIFNRARIIDALRDEFQNFQAIADNLPLRNKLKVYAKKGNIEGTIYKCGYVSLVDGKYFATKHVDFDTDDDFLEAVLASTAMPIIWKPIENIRAQSKVEPARQVVDGGIRNVSPLSDVIKEISKTYPDDDFTIIIINCNSGDILKDEPDAKRNIAQIALRSLVEISITEIFNNDIKEFMDKNYLVKQVKENNPDQVIYDYDFTNNSQGKPLKFFEAIIIQPENNVLGDTLTANRLQIKKRIDHGKEKARMALDKHLKNGDLRKFTIV